MVRIELLRKELLPKRTSIKNDLNQKSLNEVDNVQESEEKKVPFQDPRVPNVSSSPLKAKSLPRSMNYSGAVMKKAKKTKKGGLGRVKSLGLIPASNVLARLGIRITYASRRKYV